MYQINREKFLKCKEQFKEKKIIVIGDIILDEYLLGSVSRISPEAPVPIVLVEKENITLGGSGNVVKNLTSIGVSSIVFARVGNDEKANTIENLLLKENVNTKDLFLLKSENIPTTIKTRVIATHQQVCRVDREKTNPITKSEELRVLNHFQKKIQECDGVIISDYDKGFLTISLIQQIIKICLENKKFCSVDPQVRHFFQYEQVSILTPNHHEAGRALERTIFTDEEIETGAKELTKKLNSESIMITRGEKGMTIYSRKEEKIFHIPTVAKEVFDVTGAGDTVISVYTAFIVTGLSQLESAIAANASAGIVVGKLGSSTTNFSEIQNSLENMNLLT
ncbi:MAG: D-glycero-beta-D-manno-heptose-7-phosphate kinase [Leptospiraceae bacterium]|nr:D-glycero-beta-D-manno-heptose-7-phosphate kinase [Leptospiraceae bacterium]MCK6379803.1 D-glycero-beta-D-manno-heptose-7-phosphate kinase [Leptospiraceae bacterium]NUM41534.1 D-glycero-beta-D-manno-heptose-7-phosphate kinase [Leptospiraceae bacterium]